MNFKVARMISPSVGSFKNRSVIRSIIFTNLKSKFGSDRNCFGSILTDQFQHVLRVQKRINLGVESFKLVFKLLYGSVKIFHLVVLFVDGIKDRS
jgi:hypothetical protein